MRNQAQVSLFHREKKISQSGVCTAGNNSSNKQLITNVALHANAVGMVMVWMGLITLSIGIFVIECLIFIFGLQLDYGTGVLIALFNTIAGFGLGIAAHVKKRPAETWLLYGAVAWPVAFVHFFAVPVASTAPIELPGAIIGQAAVPERPTTSAEENAAAPDTSLTTLPAERLELNG